MAISFPPNSRYANCGQATYIAPDGRMISYVAQRIMPAPELFTPLVLHRLVTPDRVDMLADRYYGDSEQYWRICDANRVFWPPDTISKPNSQIVIPLPLEVSSRGKP